MSTATPHSFESRTDLPQQHADFLKNALAHLQADRRLVAVAAGGSFLSREMDEYSDLDLVIAVEPEAVDEVMDERTKIAASLGDLLAAFTGEHVGEPRLLICLYGSPLLHVDLKFVSLQEAAERVEDPAVLWEREGRLSGVLSRSKSVYPSPDLQWIEDRFWVWMHYGAAKLGRGELFEALDFLAFLRMQVLGPLSLQAEGARPTGVRKVETQAPAYLRELRRTTSSYDRRSCADALQAAADLYRRLRQRLATDELVIRRTAQEAALDYLSEVEAGFDGD